MNVQFFDDSGHTWKGMIANHILARARGWLGRKPSEICEAILLLPCRSVHFWGIRFPLVVAFLATDGRVIETTVAEPLSRPRWNRLAWAVFELPLSAVDAAWQPGRIQWRP